jgi:hypothetical protein
MEDSMNGIIYRQREVKNESGGMMPAGEDTLPLATEHLLLVADGLGGTGGFPHQRVNSDILDKDRFLAAAYAGVFLETTPDVVKRYTLDAFSELFAQKECYFNGYKNAKRSGYFASRIASSLLLNEALSAGEQGIEDLLKRFAQASGKERTALENELGERYVRCISDGMRQVAEKANLIYESKSSGMALLPTTVSLTLCGQGENGVNALFAWAGDSRGYIWNADGLKQATADHEIAEVMTNIISLRAPFYISCKFMTLSQPCVVFNASDGCFDCFTAPIDFEYCLLDAMTRAESMDAFLESMRAFFAANSSDDSSTLAMLTFGYEDYAALRTAAQQRLKKIQEIYVDPLPDIFTRDYTAELQQQKKRFGAKAAEAKKLCDSLPEVKAYCAGAAAACDGEKKACDLPAQSEAYWQAHYPDIIEHMLSGRLFSAENQKQMEALLAEELEGLRVLRAAHALREKLYEQYDEGYDALLRKEKA